MSPLEQIKAINRACGRPVVMNRFYGFGGKLEDHWSEGIGTDDTIPFPDYLNDLNVMHRAEKTLIKSGHSEKYYDELVSVTTCDRFILIHATAAQRAEAFLRTLNLWDDSI